jgi:hypothetical protein
VGARVGESYADASAHDQHNNQNTEPLHIAPYFPEIRWPSILQSSPHAHRRLQRGVAVLFGKRARHAAGAGGFAEGGRIGWPLRRGAASVVIYRSGIADIGRWQETVPTPGLAVEAVRQNLGLLIDAGRIAPTVDRCIKVCWGDPLHEQPIVARSGLGVTAAGDLIWAAGHDLSVRALAEVLAGKDVVRAMELDINPRWVAGYVYGHLPHVGTGSPTRSFQARLGSRAVPCALLPRLLRCDRTPKLTSAGCRRPRRPPSPAARRRR